MKPMKNLAQYYVDLLVKLGIVRFSILLALALVALAVVVQVGITLALKGRVDDIDIVRSVFFGLLITPWAVYFLSVVVDQLEESRQRLTKLVSKLKDMRSRDQELNYQLQQNIEKLNQEIEERIKAEEAREEAMQDLENEVFQRERTQLELAERTALLRSFIDASPDLIYYRNADGVFSGCNRAMEELTGKKEHQLVGLSLGMCIAKKSPSISLILTKRFLPIIKQLLTSNGSNTQMVASITLSCVKCHFTAKMAATLVSLGSVVISLNVSAMKSR